MKKRLAIILILMLTISLVPAFAYGEAESAAGNDSAQKTEAENAENQNVEDGKPAEETDKETVPNGWVKKNDKKYYYKKGKKVTGWKTIDDKRYYFNKYGVMQTGMKKIDGKVYYLRNGVKTVREGWHTIKGARYYGYSNGTFANKVKKIQKHVYAFRSDGQLITKKGLFKYNGKWYYGAGKGRLKTGWVAEGKKAMYFNEKTSKKTGTIGSMARNTTVGYLKIPKSGKLGEVYALGVKQLDKSGWSLMNAYTFSYRLKYGDRWYRRKTSEEYALRGFKYGYGNCYVMAATFYIQAKLLGYDVHQVAGKVDLTHSWTVIYEDGQQWVYDPNFRNETGRNGYKIYYGKKGTWRYNSYYQMN